MDGADLDMCIKPPDDPAAWDRDARCALMQRVGEALSSTKSGMLNVVVRSTARIPIVLFSDPISGVWRSNLDFCPIAFST